MSHAVRTATPDDLEAILALRREVFCVEQGVPEDLEVDGRDAAALHLCATAGDGTVVGTCRLLTDGPAWRLGRMAVRRDLRGTGIGRRLMELAHDVAAAAGATSVRLAAQRSAEGFYAGLGYVPRGNEFVEAGIPHIAMERPVP